ncbi:MAG: hypothetical protein KIT19_01935 [Phycisphaeraceae bacterium]|nr:hypothetical protein [Phycisphaeraceae bacterium]
MTAQLSDQDFHAIADRLKTQYVLVPRSWLMPVFVAAAVTLGATGWSVFAAIRSTASQTAIDAAVRLAEGGAAEVQRLREKAEADSTSLGDLALLNGRVATLESDNKVHWGSSSDLGELKSWRGTITGALRALNTRQHEVNKHVRAIVLHRASPSSQYTQQVDAFGTVATQQALLE